MTVAFTKENIANQNRAAREANEKLAAEKAKDPKWVLASLAAPGKIFLVIRHLYKRQDYQLRLYKIRGDGLLRIDQLITPEIFREVCSELVETMNRDAQLSYTPHEGGGIVWSDMFDGYNVPVHVVKALAKVVHGNRNAWEPSWL